MVLVLMLHLGVALLTEVYCDRIVMDGDARVMENYLRVARFSMYILQSEGLSATVLRRLSIFRFNNFGSLEGDPVVQSSTRTTQ